jgi:heat shock protein HtpX
MERKVVGRDLGLSVRMGIALLGLGLLYLPLPIALVLFAQGLGGSWPPAFLALAGAVGFLLYLPTLSERIALAAAGARLVSRDEEPALHAAVERLAALADLPVPRLALSPTDVPNAFTAGRSPRNAVVVVTRGLLRLLPDKELEAVLAHELAHVVNRDAFVMTLVSAPAALGHRLFSWVFTAPHRAQGPVKGVVFIALLYFFSVLLMLWILYAIATALVMTISRYREYVADSGAVLLTGAPEQLMSALQRLASELPLIPRADLRAVSGASAFFIVPVELSSDSFEIDPQRIFASHPPLDRRLARLAKEGRELGRSSRSNDAPRPADTRRPAEANPHALLAFFCAALYCGFLGAIWFTGGDEFELAWPMALAWIAGVVLAIQAAGRASAGAPGMAYAVGALGLLVGPWVLVIIGFFVVFLLGSAGIGPF